MLGNPHPRLAYPAGEGGAAILPSMVPKSRRVRWRSGMSKRRACGGKHCFPPALRLSHFFFQTNNLKSRNPPYRTVRGNAGKRALRYSSS